MTERTQRNRTWPPALAVALLALCAAPAAAQQAGVVRQPQESIVVVRGQTALLLQPVALQRLSIADPEIAEVFAVSPREILVNGKELGSTSLLLWDREGTRRLYTVEVRPDVEGLRETLRELFPGQPVTVSTSGSSLILSGQVSDPSAGRRILEIAQAGGAPVIDNLVVPPAPQIMLSVRFAEVSRTALRELGTQIRAVRFGGARLEGGRDVAVETSSDGLLRLSLFDPSFEIDAVIRALQQRGIFRTLAEPNLIARDGEEASFLAGGEFPFPIPQGGASNVITVVWKEYGVRLRFRPTVLPNGVIRLSIAPEVSSLDFSSGLRLSGFQIPSIVSRRAETEVELREGQYLAIAGLLDNSLHSTVSRVPVLGDIPILGELFRSRENRQARTELLVLVSPTLVLPTDAPPPVPSGEPEGWEWDRSLRQPPSQPSRPPAHVPPAPR